MHIHKYQAIAVNRGTFVLLGGMGTQILYRCTKCPKTKVETVSGHWPLEAFRNGKAS